MTELLWIIMHIICFFLGYFSTQYLIDRYNHKKIRPINKREKELIKRLIEIVDNYDSCFVGLCRTIQAVYDKKGISKKEAKSLMNITRNDNYSPLRYGEEKFDEDYWFFPGDKQARINHLNRLLNE